MGAQDHLDTPRPGCRAARARGPPRAPGHPDVGRSGWTCPRPDRAEHDHRAGMRYRRVVHRLRIEPLLAHETGPARRLKRDDHAITRLDRGHLTTDLLDDAHRLVAQDVPRIHETHRAPRTGAGPSRKCSYSSPARSRPSVPAAQDRGHRRHAHSACPARSLPSSVPPWIPCRADRWDSQATTIRPVLRHRPWQDRPVDEVLSGRRKWSAFWAFRGVSSLPDVYTRLMQIRPAEPRDVESLRANCFSKMSLDEVRPR